MTILLRFTAPRSRPVQAWLVMQWGLIAVVAACLGSCGEPDAAQPPAPPAPTGVSAPTDLKAEVEQPSGHQKMLDLLAHVGVQTMEDNPYLGSRTARELSMQLAQLAETGDDMKRWETLFKLSQAELKLGQEESGIEHLLGAVQILPRIRKTIDPRGILETIFQLGVANMRFGETQNCCASNSPESCIAPIQGAGVHTLEKGSRNAIACFLQVLKQQPPGVEHRLMETRWLLNLAYMTLGEYPDRVPAEYVVPPAAFESKVPFPRFTNIAAKLGVDVFNLSGGSIVDDFDGDDYLDIFTSTWDTSGAISLFHNNQDGTFTDVAKQAGLQGIVGGLNLVQADYDNDGDVDVLVLRGAWLAKDGQHPNSLLRNNGDGSFTDVTFDAGLGAFHYPTQTASWADYDNDGDLDLYIGNETNGGLTAACQLFQNDGKGGFTDVAASAGVENLRWTKAVIWADYDADGFADLYVSNFVDRNRLYHNNGDGTFTDLAPALGMERPIASFPVWFWDFNNDGAVDLFVPTYAGRVDQIAAYHLGKPTTFEPSSLYQGDGQGGFTDVAAACNLLSPMLPMGSNFGDLNGDGFLDFYLGTGDPLYSSLMPNLMFLNTGGTGFVDITMAGGFGHLQKGHGISFADLDNDGDLDVFEQMGGAFPGDKFNNAFYENPGFGNAWICVKLVGTKSNRSAIGARIHVTIEEDGKNRSIYRHVNSGGTFGANPLRQSIGLGKAERIIQIEIRWPATGQTERFDNVPMNQTISIVEGQNKYSQLNLKRLHYGGTSPGTSAQKP
jgi:hypothetical protein